MQDEGEAPGGQTLNLGGGDLDRALQSVTDREDGAFEEAIAILLRVHLLVPIRQSAVPGEGTLAQDSSLPVPVVEVPGVGTVVPVFTNAERLAEFAEKVGWAPKDDVLTYVGLRGPMLFKIIAEAEVAGALLDAAGPIPLLLPHDLLAHLTGVATREEGSGNGHGDDSESESE